MSSVRVAAIAPMPTGASAILLRDRLKKCSIEPVEANRIHAFAPQCLICNASR